MTAQYDIIQTLLACGIAASLGFGIGLNARSIMRWRPKRKEAKA